MFYFFSNLNNLVIKYSSHCSSNKSFSDIFFDKFKNLLDDYIVNYFIKYFFYFLFISFFFLEVSDGIFALMNSNQDAVAIMSDNIFSISYGAAGSFVLDLFSFMMSISVISLCYDFFSFNLDAILYLLSAIVNGNFYILGCLLFVLFYFSFILVSKMKQFNISFYTILLLYLAYSSIFYFLVSSNVISLSFYIFFTLLLFMVYPFLTRSDLNRIDYILFFTIVFTFILPSIVSFFIFLYMSYLYINENEIELKSVTSAYDFTIDEIFHALFLVVFLFVVSAGILAMTACPFSLVIFTSLISYTSFVFFLFNRG